MEPIPQLLVVIAGLLALGALGEFIFSRTGLPDAVWLVAAGVLLGPGLGIVQPELLQLAVPVFGAVALTVILSGGAYRLRLAEVARAAPRGLTLGLLGYLFAVTAIVGFLAMLSELGWVRSASPLAWVLVGAIVGGSSSLLIIPVTSAGNVDPTTATTLEVESSATDGLCIVVALALIEILLRGDVEIARPILTLLRQVGIGVAMGLVATALMIPLYPGLRGKAHGYTLFLAMMLALYGVTTHVSGNGAMAVLVASLLIGNASTIVPRLVPGARPESYVGTEMGRTMQDHTTFLVKSFFFVLIGLMFPTDPRLIALGAVAAVVLLAARAPAVWIAMRGTGCGRKCRWQLMLAYPRGLAAGVLATLPLQAGLVYMENLSQAVFALIVTSILIFSFGFMVIDRMSPAALVSGGVTSAASR